MDLDQRVEADLVLSKVGELNNTRSPARCAARYSQAFTETSSSVRFELGYVQEVDELL